MRTLLVYDAFLLIGHVGVQTRQQLLDKELLFVFNESLLWMQLDPHIESKLLFLVEIEIFYSLSPTEPFHCVLVFALTEVPPYHKRLSPWLDSAKLFCQLLFGFLVLLN